MKPPLYGREWESKKQYRWYEYLFAILLSPLILLAWPFIQPPKLGRKYGDEYDE